MSRYERDTFLGHLEALRRTLLACVAAWVIAVPVGIFLAPRFVKWMVVWSFPAAMRELNYFGLLEVFVMYMRMGLILGAVLASPYITFKLWRFLLPALYENERRMCRRWLVFAAVLFIAGAAFCVGAILPLIVRFASSFASDYLRPVLGLSNFLSLAGALIVAFGAMFQMPVAVFIAVRFGLVRVEALRRGRPYVLIVILIIAAILTPPDIVSQLLLATPTWLLFEFGLFLAARAVPPAQPDIVAGVGEPGEQHGKGVVKERTSADVLHSSCSIDEASDDTLLDFYQREAERTIHHRDETKRS